MVKGRKTIYISGKMGERILSEKTIEKFRRAERQMLDAGWTVMNPASEKFQKEMKYHVQIEKVKWELEQENGSDWGEFDWYAWVLLYDLHMMTACEAVYMLKDWQQSNGARAEYAFAVACRKTVIFEE